MWILMLIPKRSRFNALSIRLNGSRAALVTSDTSDCGYVAYDNSYNSMVGVFIECCVPAFLFWYFCGFYLFYFVPKTKKGAANTFHTSDRHLPPSTYFFVVSNNNWVFVSCNNNWVPCCDCLLSSTVVKNKKNCFTTSLTKWDIYLGAVDGPCWPSAT